MTRRAFVCSAIAVFDPARIAWISYTFAPGHSTDIHWPHADRDVNTGSLLKPFLVLAYARTHGHFPVARCNGLRDGCWLPCGHGSQNVVDALANSCNAYFLQLAEQLNRAALDSVCLSYGLSAPARDLQSDQLIGLNGGWPQQPIRVAAAFSRLAQNRPDMHVRVVLAGMAQCASTGTARAVDLRCYAKTGTARCSHSVAAADDGFVVAIYPLDEPRAVALLQRLDSTGAHAASAVRRSGALLVS